MKKKKIQNIAIAAIAAVIIGSIIGYNYYIDQINVKGFNFGNELQQIQDVVTKLQNDFSSKTVQWKEGDLTKEELLEYSNNYISEMEKIIPRYGKLIPPEPYVTSVELFKLSTESQIESDREFIKWIETGDDSHMIRSESLIQEALQYELAALADYKDAQRGLGQ
ncbi:hypothetical protein LCGC14_1652110 [marine sediment metagenome]|uniref:Uncharacterized protein n=1 Tax=marine sediment metagenome TaxID=412755 RepID=A0A0F9IJ09_9ZZZZ|nr:hypothetical protein [Nitrosopumilus sp.]